MYFQSNWLQTDQIHQDLQPSVDAWNQGKTTEAFILGETVRRQLTSPGNPGSLRAIDYNWLSETAANCGLMSRSRALHYVAHRFFPNDFEIAMMYAWDRSALGNFYQCMDILKKYETSKIDRDQVLRLAIKAYNFSVVNWKSSATKLAGKIRELVGEESLVWYILSRASAKRTDWQQSIKEGKKAIKNAIDWNYARAALIDPLIATGDTETAQMVVDSFRSEKPDAYADMSLAIFQETQDNLDAAIETYQKIVDAWPTRSHVVQFSLRKWCLLLLQLGRNDEAQQLIDKHDFKFLKERCDSTGDQKRKYISVPLISQTTNHCVPTVAAMVAGAQGVPANAVDYAEGMGTRHGTQMWQMIDYMKDQGFHCFHIKPDIDTVKSILDHDIPLIGSLSDVFSGHVDVLCGYDNQLKIFHVRDPMHWHPTGIKYESLQSKYEQAGGLYLLVSDEKIKQLSIPDTWLNPEGESLTNLSKACCLGDRVAAEKYYQEISNDHPLAFIRNCMACYVVTTETEFQEQLAQIAKKKNDDGEMELTQLQALLRQISYENADQVYQQAKDFRPQLGTQFLDYIKAQCDIARLRWTEAYQTLKDITHQWPSLENAWNLLSVVADQLGKQEESKKALQIALEIAPENAGLLSRSLRLDRFQQNYAERLDIANRLAGNHLGNPDVYFMLADVKKDDEDGLAYRKALIECSKYFPRHQGAYRLLCNWYLSQGRIDLATKTNRMGRELIGEKEFPQELFELSESEQSQELERRTKELDESLANSKKPAGNQKQETNSETLYKQEPHQQTQKHFGELLERLQLEIEGTTWKEFSELPEFQTLQTSFDEGKLPWTDSAFFLAMKIHRLIGDGAKSASLESNEFLEQFDSILPAKVPGVGELFADSVLERIPQDNLPDVLIKKILAWIDRITDGLCTFAPLQFQRACFLEEQGKYTESESILKRILESSPAYTPAIFRLACIQVSRNNISEGRKLFKKCLKVHPGHYGSLFYLRSLADADDYETREKYSRRISTLLPFDTELNLQTAIDVGKSGKDPSYGHAFLNRRKERFSANIFPLMEAQFYLAFAEFEKALEHANAAEIDDNNETQVYWTRFRCFSEDEQYRQALICIEKILERKPEDVDAVEEKARLLSALEEDATSYANQQIQKEIITPLIALLSIPPQQPPIEPAIQRLNDAESPFKERVAESFLKVLEQPEYAENLGVFLASCCDAFPENKTYQYKYAANLFYLGKVKKALPLANELVSAVPENPDYLLLAGLCSQESAPKKAIELLEKSYSITGSLQAKLSLAESLHLTGNVTKAKKMFYELLEVDKENDYLLCTIYQKFQDTSKAMFQNFCRSIEEVRPEYETGFHLIAIEVARKNNQPLPAAWIDSAKNHVELTTDKKEKAELEFRIRQWLDKWRDPSAKNYGSWQSWLKVRFSKDRSWIPTKPYKKTAQKT